MDVKNLAKLLFLFHIFYCVLGEGFDVVINIIPSGPILLREGEELNLTCRVTSQLLRFKHLEIYWSIPTSPSDNGERIKSGRHGNEVSLWIPKIKEIDEGNYACEVSDKDKYSAKNITNVMVLAVEGSCSSIKQFKCDSGECIFKSYVCDGVPDCKDQSDETLTGCGFNPCDGKLRCDNGRCIDKRACCNQRVSHHCQPSYMDSCCLNHFSSEEYPTFPQRPEEMTQLKSTVYTVIGCSVAFVLVVAIMVVAICRYHMNRRAELQAQQRRVFLQQRWQEVSEINPEYQEPFIPSASSTTIPHSCPHGMTNLLVTYNINNGIQIMSQPVEPPTYTEAANQALRPGTPPPPYSTLERPSRTSSTLIRETVIT